VEERVEPADEVERLVFLRSRILTDESVVVVRCIKRERIAGR
jgi:hypothetical protein